MMIERPVIIDCSGDDKRHIKYADLLATEIIDTKWFGLIKGTPRYHVVHIPSGITNGCGRHFDERLEYAIADCIWNVIKTEMKPTGKWLTTGELHSTEQFIHQRQMYTTSDDTTPAGVEWIGDAKTKGNVE